MDSKTRENLGVSAYHRLKIDIIRNVYKPGEKLLMSRLKERYDLGVGPLREALSQLVAERLVVAISQRGFRVAPMSLAELNDIYDARAQIEGLLLRLSIERGDDSWEADILARAHTLSKVVKVNSSEELLEVWDTRHQAFHSAIVSGCRSPHLLQIRDSLFDQVERYRHLWLRETVLSEEALARKHQEHTELVEVILARDIERATRMMRDHLMTPVPIITEAMRQQGLA
ncbi:MULTISPECIES: DNA-binding transcriptional regulator CsiR [unclassified Halomonas]|uniref:DNA-binding transcriptional regulator CsiR n=1 Tax=unclassified Halomonas TaxID=2609666 RepID=UPI0028845EC5|nr:MULTISPECIES: DNA-binding transcriptional regulator CsiR [unclassified Halomonas]MDT0500428.1 DNA-binding transcriptional regulator CsiR [Halomonas sp. PAR7]MDT0511675.1 DNA-binding transcriptional regulator CsiR [Halomonas sp. LES1]MDT0590037.1 DNA-binding transcriptional regulator CsiR [Halomonas sp. PAR8]